GPSAATDDSVDLTAPNDDVPAATSGPLSVVDSTVTDVKLSADSSRTRIEQSAWTGGDISVQAASATLLDNTLDHARIRVTDVTDQPVDVEGNTVSSPSGSGIQVLSTYSYPTTLATDVRVRDNTVTGGILDSNMPVYPRPT